MRVQLGDKFYKYDKEKDILEVLRVKRFKNQTTLILSCEDNIDKKVTLQYNDLINNYTRIKPDGLIGVSILELQYGIKDVAISLYKTEELEKGTDNLPYAVCRQNIVNFFADQLNNTPYSFLGMSMSKDTVPEGIEYEMVLACDKVIDTVMIAVYLDDTFETIYGLINPKKYDEVLTNLSNMVKKENSMVIGYNSTLKDLMIETEFMYDFHSAFKIIPVEFKVETIEVEGVTELLPEQKIYLEDLLKTEIFKTYVIKYTKEINIKEIKRDFILLADNAGDIYIIAFDQGKYINRYYRTFIKDKRDALIIFYC